MMHTPVHTPTRPKRPSCRLQVRRVIEVLEVRADKPILTLRSTITNQDGTVVLDRRAVVWIEPLDVE
jgi:hypothetical protein